MTIVAGFLGRENATLDGRPERGFVVLGADSEETGTLLKSSVRKIATVDKGDCKCLIAGAGNGFSIDFAVQEIEAVLGPPYTFDDVRKRIEDVVTNIYASRIEQYPVDQREDMEFELLCGIWVKGSADVQLVRVRRALSLILKLPTTIGIGSYLARYLIATLSFPTMTLYQTTRFAAYVLAQVKKHVPSCGGSSQVMWIDGVGTIDELWPGSVSQHELSTSVVMEGGAKWLFHFCDPMGWGFDLTRVDQVVDDAADHVKKDLKLFWGNMQKPSPSPSPSPGPEAPPSDAQAPPTTT